MHFSPRNRHLLIEILEEQEEAGASTPILLPEDYSPPAKEYVLARVVDWSPDCNGQFWEDDIIVVKQNMIEKIEVSAGVYSFVLENYVVGVASEEYESYEDDESPGEMDIN